AKTTGQGEPALFSHCSLAHSGAWDALRAQLADHWTVTAIDLPDHGRSNQTPDGTDPQRLAADVLIDFAQDTGQKPHLIGHSFGATAALLAAVSAPDDWASLTLIEPVMFGWAKGTAAWDEHAAALASFPSALISGDRPLATSLFMDVWGGGVPFRHLPKRQQAYIEQRIHIIAAQGPALNDDFNGVLPLVQSTPLMMPITLIQGDQSPAIARAILDVLHQHLPQAHRHQIDGAGHMLPLTHAADVAKILRAL
ncbi:MAG: alpha/beta fold hydrolase, partial [Pseudomonadota bacterium]